jgi:hypothetical protein
MSLVNVTQDTPGVMPLEAYLAVQTAGLLIVIS